METFVILGLIVSINIIVLIYKFRIGRYADAFLDLFILIALSLVFSGTFSALVTGDIASAFVSLYLYFRPVSLGWLTDYINGIFEEDYDD